jgi:hypothetical protein
MKYLVTNICYARTGSNYFTKLIETSFNNINAHYELFNRQKCHLNTDYLEKATEIFKTNDLKTEAHNNPQEFLEKMIDMSSEDIISHKLFPEHLDLSEVFKIIDRSAFIFILKRNFIDVYISKKKAILLAESHDNPWINLDTTNVKIVFDKDEFKEMETRFNDWYIKVVNYLILNDIKFQTIEYDSFHSLDVHEQQILIRDNLCKTIPAEFLDISDNAEVLQKQDKSLDFKTKVSNYGEFMDFMVNEYLQV